MGVDNAIKLRILYSEMETLVPSNQDLAEARFPQKFLNLMALRGVGCSKNSILK